MTTAQKIWIVFSVITAGLLCYLLAPVLTPFIISLLLAYLASPLVKKLENRNLPRLAAVIIVFLVIIITLILLPVILIPLLEKQIAVFVTNWPKYVDWLQNIALPWIQFQLGWDRYSVDLSVVKRLFLENWRAVGGTAAAIVNYASHSSMMLVAWIANIVLVPVVTFYMLRDWESLVHRLREFFPRSIEPVLVKLAGDCDEVLGTFMRGQMVVMMVLGSIYATGLWISGLDLAILIGFIAGLVSFVPYLGLIVGIIIAGIASIMQFHDVSHLLPIFIVFGVGQLLEGMVLTPVLVGDRIGLHPVAVIFAIMVGGQLFGFFGILLALPVAAVLAVILRYMHQQYLESQLYNADEDDIS
ncbi:MAG: AI-2E family transporter [Gammaproteobacteria bacterium]